MPCAGLGDMRIAQDAWFIRKKNQNYTKRNKVEIIPHEASTNLAEYIRDAILGYHVRIFFRFFQLCDVILQNVERFLCCYSYQVTIV